MRICHFIHSSRSLPPAATTLNQLAASMGRLGHIGQNVFLLGGSPLQQMAEKAGLVVDAGDVSAISTPFGQPWFAAGELLRQVRRCGPFDVIHCWSIETLSFAVMALRRVPCVLSLLHEPTPRQVRWLRLLNADRPQGPHRITFLTMSATIRRALLAGGVDEAVVHVLRPAIDMAMVDTHARADLRRRWGIDPQNDKQTRIIALLSDPPMRSDAHVAGLITSITNAVHPDLHMKLLVHPDQCNRLRIQRILKNLNTSDLLICDDEAAAPWRVLPGCDAAFAPAQGGGGLSLLWAMAANIPILGEADYSISEIVEDRHSALLAKPGEMQGLARRLGQILTDQHLAWKLRDTARHEAYSFFSRKNYCQALTTAYQQVHEGTPIQLPDLQITGGLRFTGRA